MTKEDVKEKLEKAVQALVTNQPDIFAFAPGTSPTEWNLQRHLANEIARLFPGYACDTDVLKKPFKNHRPDIIVHKRGNHDDNFLAIEVKKDGRPSGIKKDIDKIKKEWFAEPLSYQFGAVVDLRSDKTAEIQVFENKHR